MKQVEHGAITGHRRLPIAVRGPDISELNRRPSRLWPESGRTQLIIANVQLVPPNNMLTLHLAAPFANRLTISRALSMAGGLMSATESNVSRPCFAAPRDYVGQRILTGRQAGRSCRSSSRPSSSSSINLRTAKALGLDNSADAARPRRRGDRMKRRYLLHCMSRLLACAVKRRRFPVGARPTRQPLQPEATGAVMEVTKWLKPSDSVSRYTVTARVCRP